MSSTNRKRLRDSTADLHDLKGCYLCQSQSGEGQSQRVVQRQTGVVRVVPMVGQLDSKVEVAVFCHQ